MSLSETRMIARALVQRWPIKQEYREAIVKQLLKVVVDPNSTPREKTSAAKALLAAEGQNQSDEHKVIDVRITTRHDQLDAIASDLGIDIDTIEAAQRKAIGGTGSDANGTNAHERAGP